jgi:isopentenyldiphosphate isomerase
MAIAIIFIKFDMILVRVDIELRIVGEREKIKIFDDNKNLIGEASRSDVHRIGYWHEAFHCWFISNEKGNDYIYLQLSSKNKKDYPNLFDITAAGHLLADETVEDGVRESKEEIGIDVAQLIEDYKETSRLVANMVK